MTYKQTVEEMDTTSAKLTCKELEQLHKIQDPEFKRQKKEELTKKMILVKSQLDEYKNIEEELIKKI